MSVYRYLDRPIDRIDPALAVIVAAMRTWVTGARSGRCPCGLVARILALDPQSDGLRHFNVMMATIDHESGRALTFGHRCAPNVSDDEAAILALYAAAARDDESALRRMAASAVETAAIDTLCSAMRLLAATLSLHDFQDRS